MKTTTTEFKVKLVALVCALLGAVLVGLVFCAPLASPALALAAGELMLGVAAALVLSTV